MPPFGVSECLLENRRKTGTKWNTYLPGEGMLIYRVDSTDVQQWSNNTINADPSHNYYEMVRAKPNGTGLAIKDSDGDPFPGSGNVHEVGPFTEPALISWNDRFNVNLQLEEINEDSNGVITFKERCRQILQLVIHQRRRIFARFNAL